MRASSLEKERKREEHQEDEEQDLRDSRGGSCDATESKDPGDQRDDQKDNCVVKHLLFPLASAGGLSFESGSLIIDLFNCQLSEQGVRLELL